MGKNIIQNTVADKDELNINSFKIINESLDDTYDDLCKNAIPFCRHVQRYWMRRWEYCKAIFHTYFKLKQDIEIVDVGGAGSIFNVNLKTKYFIDVTVTDNQQKKIDYMGEINNYVKKYCKTGIDYLKHDIVRDSLCKENFDIVYCISVIEHLEKKQQVKALINIRDAVKYDGIVVLSFDYGCHPRLNCINNKHDLLNLLDKAGFKFMGDDFDDRNFNTKKRTFGIVFLYKE